jgi:hypothetical protein
MVDLADVLHPVTPETAATNTKKSDFLRFTRHPLDTLDARTVKAQRPL